MYIKFNPIPSPYDCDDTLIMWDYPEEEIPNTVTVGEGRTSRRVLPNKRNIEALKNAKARGHLVIVWSAGGADWAESVVKALELEDFVDVIVSKFFWYCDDVDLKDWAATRFYYPLEKKCGK